MNRYAEEFVEAVGTVVFLLSNAGTKSEERIPFLYVNRNLMYQLYLKGDNPFENKGFLPYDGKRVRVSGVKKENVKKIYAEGTLIADTVAPAEDPESAPGPVSPAENTSGPSSGKTPSENGECQCSKSIQH